MLYVHCIVCHLTCCAFHFILHYISSAINLSAYLFSTIHFATPELAISLQSHPSAFLVSAKDLITISFCALVIYLKVKMVPFQQQSHDVPVFASEPVTQNIYFVAGSKPSAKGKNKQIVLHLIQAIDQPTRLLLEYVGKTEGSK